MARLLSVVRILRSRILVYSLGSQEGIQTTVRMVSIGSEIHMAEIDY